MDHVDVAVIGAGFGGLATALTLVDRGADVTLFERLTYPGGCASTFSRQGYRFESGATLISGLGDGQLFRRWIDDYELDVEAELLDPVVELRTPTFELSIPGHRDGLVEQLCDFEAAPADRIRQFFIWQKKIADTLWELFDDPSLLPPLDIKSLSRHLVHSPRYARLFPLINRSLREILEARNLWDFRPLRTYLDALCQITVQTSAERAEAPFALAAMDYLFRGAGHIHGGIGRLAESLATTIEERGGQVHYADAVEAIEKDNGQWIVESRRRELSATTIVANLPPHNLAELLDISPAASPTLRRLDDQVETGWGAAMLYRGLAADRLSNPSPHHIELIDDPDAPFREGNHLFCSVSGAGETDRAPTGERVATISTHVDMNRLLSSDESDRADYIDAIYRQMRTTIERRAPQLHEATVSEMTASPRTFERFTARYRGYVGGIPREVGFHNYRQIGPQEIDDGLYLVGDTIFPGQSTLAVAIGGIKTAQAII